MNATIATINVQGLGTLTKLNYLYNYINNENLDIVCIQEIGRETPIFDTKHYSIILNKKNQLGTAIIYKNSLTLKESATDDEGRVIMANFHTFTIVNVYGYQGSQGGKKNLFFQKILPAYTKTNNDIIITGDFNATYRNKSKNQNKHLNLLIKTLELVEANTYLNPNDKTPTLISHAGISRIDHFFLNENTKEKLKKCKTMPYLQSDHQAVVIEIGLPENKKKKFPTPYWKMNLKNLNLQQQARNINGKTGKSITMTRGIKQGCPLAGFLYIIYIESLQLEIQRRITASRIGSEQIQTGGFIDDITIFISDETDLKEVEKILEEFQETTNSKINKNKTTIMGLGSWTGRKKWPLTWIKTTPSTKILGIEHFPTTQEITEKLEKKTTKIIKILLTQTNQRILTLQQRVQYFNLHVIPIICHGATIYPIRNNTTKEINKLAYAFVWKGKWEKLTKEECYLPAEEGGLGLIEASAKASSVNLNSIRKNLFSKSKQMEYLLGYEAKFIKSPEPGPKKETTPLFFKQILKKAKKMKQNNPDLTWTEINAKKIYELLVKVTKPKIFNNNPTNNYQLTLRNINKINHLPETKEFLFQFMHNILPTKVRLKRCRANIETDCAHCEDTPEDREHILRCPSSKAAITWMMNQIAKITDSEALNNLTVQQILYLDFNINDKKENTKVAWITAHFCLTLWKERKINKTNQISFKTITKTKQALQFYKNHNKQ